MITDIPGYAQRWTDEKCVVCRCGVGAGVRAGAGVCVGVGVRCFNEGWRCVRAGG
jgi:hypothetical protein